MVSLKGQYWDRCCLIFINDIDSGIKRTFSRFVDDIKMCGAADMAERWDVIQRHQARLEQWAQENLMRLNKTKCKLSTWVIATPTVYMS